MTLEVGGRSVKDNGAPVAYLSYAGPVITVHRMDNGTAGRLVKHPGDRYDAWTALHPAAPTPADTKLAADLPIAEAIAVILAQYDEET
jgi:hypothetical protein